MEHVYCAFCKRHKANCWCFRLTPASHAEDVCRRDCADCRCAITLEGLIDLSHPLCALHGNVEPHCPAHGGEFAPYQCKVCVP